MRVRNVVKVMNFHSLLRVDSSKRTANRYQQMEAELMAMIDGIVNNRNLLLDKKTLAVDRTKPELCIYLGSDFGFCSNFNSRINEEIRKDREAVRILIGRKLYCADAERLLFRMDCERFRADMSRVQETALSGIREMGYSRITLVYNHYVNTSSIELRRKQIFPVETGESGRHSEDFVVEGDLDRLLADLVMTYVRYEIMLADVFSKAAENLMRQNATNDSLKRIDEIEEEQHRQALREKRETEFAKVIDSFIKMKSRDGLES